MAIDGALTKRRCANCRFDLGSAPVELDREIFCCVGCARGGPCGCAYDFEQSEQCEIRSAPVAALTRG